MQAALRAMLTDTLVHAAYLTQDGYGAPIYAAAVSIPARIEWEIRRVVDAMGQERVSRCKVFLDGAVVIDLRDQLILPDGTKPPLLSLASPRDLDGTIAHHEVML